MAKRSSRALALGILGAAFLAGSGRATDGPAEYDHRLEVDVSDHSPMPSDARIVVSGDLETNSDAISEGDNYASWDPGIVPALEILYNGEISLFNWSDGGISTYRDGNRVDPYELSSDGPRNRQDTTGGDMIEVTIYQTRELYNRNGYAPSRAAARYISNSLSLNDTDHDILYDLPVIDLPTQNPLCDEGILDDETDRSPPAAYSWWRETLQGRQNTLSAYLNQELGVSLSASGDTYTQRKDSNLLLVDANGGGCHLINGQWGVAGAAAIDHVPPFAKGPHEDGTHQHIWVAMHELGHAFGYIHPPDPEPRFAGGRMWHTESGSITFLDRSPCSAGYGIDNACGFRNAPEQGHDYTREWTHFTACTVNEIFRGTSTAREQGNVRVSSSDQHDDILTADGAKASGSCPGCRL